MDCSLAEAAMASLGLGWFFREGKSGPLAQPASISVSKKTKRRALIGISVNNRKNKG